MQPDFAAYERAARDRVTALDGEIDAETFAVAFNAFRLSTWLLQDFETNVYRPHGLSLAGFRLLFTLWTLGDLPPAEVARLAGVTKAAVSASLNTLERDGLASRIRSETDARRVTVRLTAAGARRVEAVYRVQNERERELFRRFSRQELTAIASEMRALLSDHDPAPRE